MKAIEKLDKELGDCVVEILKFKTMGIGEKKFAVACLSKAFSALLKDPELLEEYRAAFANPDIPRTNKLSYDMAKIFATWLAAELDGREG
jgi:hypothetical protein